MDNNDNLQETQNVQSVPAPKTLLNLFQISVEPIFLLMFFCFSLVDAAGTNFLLVRSCTMVFGFSDANCTHRISPSIQEIIQPYTARIIMGKVLIEAIFPTILSLFIGSWTDGSKKRKPFIILPVIGMTIDYAIWLIFIYFPIPPVFVLFTILPYSLTGGNISLFICAYCYLSDITNEDNRAFRMSVLTISLTIGMLCGYLVSTEIYKTFHKNINFIIFGTSLCCMILTLLYTIFLLPETVITAEETENSRERRNRKSFFNISHVKDSLAALLKARPSNGRPILLLLIAIIVIDIVVFQACFIWLGLTGFGFSSSMAINTNRVLSSTLCVSVRHYCDTCIGSLTLTMDEKPKPVRTNQEACYDGESNFRYLSLKANFHWTVEDYNVFSAILSGVAVIISLVGIWLLNKVLGLSCTFTIVLVLSTCFISSVLVSLSKSPTGFYSAALFGCLVVLLSPLIKSEMSHLVPNSDIGKVFAFTSTLEAVTPFAATPAYTEVYNAVISTKPLYLYFLSAGFWLLALILSLSIVCINCCYGHKYLPLEDELARQNESNSINN